MDVKVTIGDLGDAGVAILMKLPEHYLEPSEEAAALLRADTRVKFSIARLDKTKIYGFTAFRDKGNQPRWTYFTVADDQKSAQEGELPREVREFMLEQIEGIFPGMPQGFGFGCAIMIAPNGKSVSHVYAHVDDVA